jgi:DNA-binding transcriptional ArsR family regulator
MVKYSEKTLPDVFGALADPIRLSMVERLSSGTLSVSDLARQYDVSLPAISRHLRVLKRAGLLKQERDGRVRHCRLQTEPLERARAWIEFHRRFWEAQLDALDAFLATPEGSRDSSTNTGAAAAGTKPARRNARKKGQ